MSEQTYQMLAIVLYFAAMLGIGYYAYTLSDAFLNVLPGLGSRMHPQKGAEVFYNWAVTPWFRLQADAQWVAPFNGVDDNYYLGMSAHFKFF